MKKPKGNTFQIYSYHLIKNANSSEVKEKQNADYSSPVKKPRASLQSLLMAKVY